MKYIGLVLDMLLRVMTFKCFLRFLPIKLCTTVDTTCLFLINYQTYDVKIAGH